MPTPLIKRNGLCQTAGKQATATGNNTDIVAVATMHRAAGSPAFAEDDGRACCAAL